MYIIVETEAATVVYKQSQYLCVWTDLLADFILRPKNLFLLGMVIATSRAKIGEKVSGIEIKFRYTLTWICVLKRRQNQREVDHIAW